MTFKDLSSLIGQQGDDHQDQFPDWLLDILHNIPFWINDEQKHNKRFKETEGTCCFNDVLGRPLKYGQPKPLFQLQTDIIIPAYEKYDAIWILKATGLGLSELTLRWLMWKAITGNSNKYYRSIIPIVVGPNIELAKKLILRAKHMWFNRLGITFHAPDRELQLPTNDVTIEAFPSHNVNAFRSLENVSIIMVDEGDYFPPGQQTEVLVAAERYRGKSGAKIILVSTPGIPGGLMERIDRDPNSINHKLKLDYTYGINTIYTEVDLEKAKLSPSFDREYNLAYLGGVGNVFHIGDIEAAFSETYSLDASITESIYFGRGMGIDSGYGSSEFAIVIQQVNDRKVEIIFADSFSRLSLNESTDIVFKLVQKHHIGKVYVDASDAGLITSLKEHYREFRNYHLLDPKVVDGWITSPVNSPKIVPINFNRHGRSMLDSLVKIFENRMIRIDKRFDKLNIFLRTAMYRGDRDELDKEASSNDDIGDALRLACLNVRFRYRGEAYHHTNVDPNAQIKLQQQQKGKSNIENLFHSYPWIAPDKRTVWNSRM